MLSQNGVPMSTAPTKSQTRSGVLTPASDNSLDPSDGNVSGSRKRKRDGTSLEDLLKDSFVVRPYPHKLPVKPRTLQPILLLPRALLPLSSLDTRSSSNPLSQSRLFETHVKILELEERMGSQPMLLIARLDDGRALYAVEREARGLYVMCKLGSWVNVQQMKAVAAVSTQVTSTSSEMNLGGSEATHATIAPPIATTGSSKFSNKKRLAIEAIQSMVKRPSVELLGGLQSINGVEESVEMEAQPAPATHGEETLGSQIADDAMSQPTATEIFENVRTQYFEGLYLSKASLAYFAKGPLSRARAAFHLDYDSALDMKDHIAFLESLILSTTMIDKKYREGVPTCVSLIDIQDHSADEAALTKAKKKRSSKKPKPGKNGLYPGEDGLIRRWWAFHDDDAESGAPDTSKDDLSKNRIAQIRIRETQLQIILILEVLALQPLASEAEEICAELPGVVSPTTGVSDVKEKPAKAKKPEQLITLIDVHIDRLCIWQSIDLESGKAPAGDSQSTENAPKSSDNPLRDFCVEVIAPFFSARLPDQCAVINRKLGGPVVISPPKPKLSKSASFSGGAAKPGAATKRPVPIKPARSLKRVLTDDRERRSMSAGPSRAISLMRSATMPAATGIKREASEAPSLSGIPTADSLLFAANRGGLLKSKRFAQREIDLSSLVPDANTKALKQAKIEAELKEAIAALKKPNRELAGKVLAETAEKRSVSASHPRKSKKPIRNPFFQSVQISATPKANRQISFSAKSQAYELPRMAEDTEIGAYPPSSLPRVPQSSQPSQEKASMRNPLFASVQATPTRKASASQNSLLGLRSVDYGHFLPSSPLHVRQSSAFPFSAVSESAVKSLPELAAPSSLQETPVKRRIDFQACHSHPEVVGLGSNKENESLSEKVVTSQEVENAIGQVENDSIYKSLGWDDADDLDHLA